MSPLRDELSRLVAAFGDRLQHLQRSGIRWLPAAPMPRSTVSTITDSTPRGNGFPDEASDSHSEPEPSGDAAAPGQPVPSLEAVREELGDCQRCGLSKGRRNLVFGIGAPAADVMFIGEAPGQQEDRQGEPFVGAAGELLTKMINAMGLSRDVVYIANVIKCRPPRNRDPLPEEISTCEPFLRQQIAAVRPKLLVALGGFAAKTLLQTDTGITRLRGRWHTYCDVPLMPTFHPAYLLRNPQGKRAVWSDLQLVMERMDRLGIDRRR